MSVCVGPGGVASSGAIFSFRKFGVLCVLCFVFCVCVCPFLLICNHTDGFWMCPRSGWFLLLWCRSGLAEVQVSKSAGRVRSVPVPPYFWSHGLGLELFRPSGVASSGPTFFACGAMAPPIFVVGESDDGGDASHSNARVLADHAHRC